MVLADIFFCTACAWTNEFPEGRSHFWWHALLPFDSRNLDIFENSGKDEQPFVQPFMDVYAKLTNTSVVDGHALQSISAPQNSSLLINMSLPAAEKLQVPSDHNPLVMESMKELKDEVMSLDVKITQRLDVMEAKLMGMENKLDAMVAEVRRLMDALLVTRS